MNLLILLITVFLCSVAADPQPAERIAGGYATSVQDYPYAAAVLYSSATAFTSFELICGATILTNQAVLSAAHCFFDKDPGHYRIRIGSSNAKVGGILLVVASFTIHPDYVAISRYNDLVVVRSTTVFAFTNVIRPAVMSKFDIDPEEVVWAIGFGDTQIGSTASDQLRQVQLWTVDQTECTDRYDAGKVNITEDMLCAGWLNFGGRGSCLTDAGGPLINNGIVVGVSSFSIGCGDPTYPGVYSRISSYFNWIQANK